MPRAESSHIIEADKGRVWRLAADIGGVHRFHPFVKHSPVLSAAHEGLGAQRRCILYGGSSVVETVTGWNPESSIDFEISELSFLIRQATASMLFEAVGTDRTRVTVVMEYEMKLGPLGWVIGRAMAPVLTRKFKRVLQSLNEHIVTGRLVGEKGVLLENA